MTIVFSYISRITMSGHSLSWNTLECRLSRTSLDRNANYPFVRASMTGDRASSDNMLNPNSTIDRTFSKEIISTCITLVLFLCLPLVRRKFSILQLIFGKRQSISKYFLAKRTNTLDFNLHKYSIDGRIK